MGVPSVEASNDVWNRIIRLSSGRRYDAVDAILELDIRQATADRDLDRLGNSRIAYGLHQQKVGRLAEARRQLRAATAYAAAPGQKYDVAFYLAKVASQEGRHDEALRAYQRLEAQLRSGAAGLDGAVFLARYETLVWRQAFSSVMTSEARAAGLLFDLHRELARPHSNQEAINWVYGRVLPVLTTGGPAQLDNLGDALAATDAYKVANLTSRFTHPHIALVQRDLLRAIEALRRKDSTSSYLNVWRAGFALKACQATPVAEGIAEFVTILSTHMPEAHPMISAATGDWAGIDQVLS